jgi:hypothetical protein
MRRKKKKNHDAYCLLVCDAMYYRRFGRACCLHLQSIKIIKTRKSHKYRTETGAVQSG